MQDVLHQLGFASEIFVCSEHLEPTLRNSARTLEELSVDPTDIVLYHHSIGSDAGERMGTLECRRVMVYHNITPASQIRPFNPAVAAQLDWGRDQLGRLTDSVEMVIADSPYNEREVREIGYAKTTTLPILLHETNYRIRPDRRTIQKLSNGHWNVVFVGRLAPNKCPHDLIKSFHIFRRFIHPSSSLILVGSYGGFETYHRALAEMVRELELDSSVVMTGRVSQQELLAHYQTAHTFLCLSAHEGFCVPIVEAFRSRVPVVALGSGAVPDTLGDAGILMETADPLVIAESLEAVRSNPQLRGELIERGYERYETQFSPQSVAVRFREIIANLVD